MSSQSSASKTRLSDQLWARLFSDPSGVRAFPEARRIPLTLIDPNPEQPRQRVEGIEELASHIKEYGLLQPVVVSGPQGEPGLERYELVAGQRRVAAFRWLAEHDAEPDRWGDVPAVVRRVDTAERLILAVSENVSRHDLSEVEVMSAIRLLRDLHNWSQSEIARRMGVSRQWISQYFIAGDDPTLAGHIQAGRLTAAKAYEVQRAHSAETRDASLSAALAGAPLREIRDRAAGRTEPARQVQPPAPATPSAQAAPAVQAPVSSVAQPAPAAPVILPAQAVQPESPRSATQAVVATGPSLEERASHAADVEIAQLRTTALIRECLSRGIRRMRAASLLVALRADLAQIERLIG